MLTVNGCQKTLVVVLAKLLNAVVCHSCYRLKGSLQGSCCNAQAGRISRVAKDQPLPTACLLIHINI